MSETTAYHEAGHALIAVLLGGKVTRVTIDPDDDDEPQRFGDTQILWRHSSTSDQRFAEITVQVSLAGPVAEMIYTGDSIHPGVVPEWAADWRDAWNAVVLLQPVERKRMEYLEQVSVQLYQRFQRTEIWSALAALADHLLAPETLEAEEVEDIVREWL